MIIGIDALGELMIKKVVSFCDKHRLFLVLLILIFIIILFLSINSYLFLHYDFKALNCTNNIDENYCYHDNKKILIKPESSKKEFFKKYEKVIQELKTKYHLADFNFYTAYYYLTASKLHYEINGEYKVLQDFFESYVNTYNLEEFYLKNNFYFNIFYHYKIN